MSAAKPKRAVILTRVSTEEQVDGTSLGDQERLCRSLIESRGWEFTGRIYEDAGVSGTVENRPALTEAMRDAAKGEFDALVALNLSRLSRKQWISTKAIEDLNDLDVAFVSVQEAFIDTSTSAGRGMAGIFSSFAQMDRDSLVEKTARGQRAKGEAGLWPGGHPPFGWRLEGFKRTARPVPDDREREVLAEAYRLLVTQRKNAYEVAARLNDAGLHPRLAKEWHPESLRRILANPSLASGVVMWGAAAQGQSGFYPRSHKTKVRRDGTPKYGAPIRIELDEPPFTPAEHRSITRALARRSTRGKAAHAVSRPLTGQVYGECGMSYYGVTIKGKPAVMRCTGRRHLRGDEKCTCKQVAHEPLEARVWGAVSEFLTDPARLEAMARQYLELPTDAGDGVEDSTLLSAVERQITKLEGAQSNVARELLLADNPAPIRAALAEIEQDLAGLRERREGYRALASSVREKGEALRDLAELAERARGNLHLMAEEQRREVYRILRVRVLMAGAVVTDEQRVAHPERLQISGVLDPRLWGDEGRGGGSGGGNQYGGPRPLPGSPASDTAAPSSFRHGEDCARMLLGRAWERRYSPRASLGP
ncbi:recombinase family protein [Cryobacterium sp. BB307]|uniref:recombinase family protein n=1 Tax=Cryobacterium sp. BB307 TaxID=2716317 RepID=UPI001B2FFB44